jgi:hypothetical protein
MPLPFVLAGPILRRRAEPARGAPDPLIRGDLATPTLRCAPHVHVALALLRIPQDSAKTLQPGVVYSYDVEIVETTSGACHTLASLGLRRTAPNSIDWPPKFRSTRSRCCRSVRRMDRCGSCGRQC